MRLRDGATKCEHHQRILAGIARSRCNIYNYIVYLVCKYLWDAHRYIDMVSKPIARVFANIRWALALTRFKELDFAKGSACMWHCSMFIVGFSYPHRHTSHDCSTGGMDGSRQQRHTRTDCPPVSSRPHAPTSQQVVFLTHRYRAGAPRKQQPWDQRQTKVHNHYNTMPARQATIVLWLPAQKVVLGMQVERKRKKYPNVFI